MTVISRKQHNMTWADRILRGFIYLASFVLVLGLLVYDRSQDTWDFQFAEGDPSPRTVYAPFDFSYVNQKATEDARQIAQSQVPSVFHVDLNIEKEASQKIKSFLEEIENSRKIKKKEDVEPSQFVESLELSDSEIKALDDEGDIMSWQAELDGIVHDVVHTGIISSRDKYSMIAQGKSKIILLDDKQEFEIDTGKLITIDDAQEKLADAIQEKVGRNRRLRDVFNKVLISVLQPNLVFDEKATAKRKEAAVKNTPEIRIDIKKGEMVILRGRRVTADQIKGLDVIQKRTKNREIFRKLLSQGLIVLLLYFLLGSYFRYFEPKIGFSAKFLILIHGLIVSNLLISKIILYFGWSSYLIPVSLASLLLVPLVKARVGFTIGFVMATLSSLLCGWSLEVFLFGLFGSLIGVFSAQGIRKRIEFVKVGIWVGASQTVSIFAAQLFQGTPMMEAGQIAAYGLANGLLVTLPLFTLLLPLLEHWFNLTTDITLLELSDLNHPLLKRMVIEAPGTYHHSLIVSHLSEEACKVIGANALLARVGAYFHDIGKMVKAEYFVENQHNKDESKHHQLTPQMSSMVILSHVKKGVELAKKFKLKDVIINFIPEHQGTGVIYYFYRKALDQKKENDLINPDDYRYPGPKPQSKETAIVMIADSVEAASRSLGTYTPDAIRELVTRIILDKLRDEQLDECDLTMNDLGEVKESFIRSLLAVYHTRIPYPKKEEDNFKANLPTGIHRDPLSQVPLR